MRALRCSGVATAFSVWEFIASLEQAKGVRPLLIDKQPNWHTHTDTQTHKQRDVVDHCVRPR